jgi:CrcB protein
MGDRDPLLPVDPDTGTVIGREPIWDVVLVIAVGGAIGGGARYLLSTVIQHERFPWATFAANVIGCLLLGVVMVLVLEKWQPHRYARPFMAVGVLGGFTTFSAYTLETHALLMQGRVPAALAYLFGSLAVGILATWGGISLTRRVA